MLFAIFSQNNTHILIDEKISSSEGNPSKARNWYLYLRGVLQRLYLYLIVSRHRH